MPRRRNAGNNPATTTDATTDATTRETAPAYKTLLGLATSGFISNIGGVAVLELARYQDGYYMDSRNGETLTLEAFKAKYPEGLNDQNDEYASINWVPGDWVTASVPVSSLRGLTLHQIERITGVTDPLAKARKQIDEALKGLTPEQRKVLFPDGA